MLGIVACLVLCSLCQGVTVIPSTLNLPRPFTGSAAASSAHELLMLSAGKEIGKAKVQVRLSSVGKLSSGDGIRASTDSFVRGAIEAWGQHHHLVIRPESVWFSILAQMNFYMGKHADDPEIRSTFVSHQGKEEILIEDITLQAILPKFQYEIQKRVKTDWLLDWIQPNFTTSTSEDNMTANFLMMGLMKQYFDFTAGIICGLPSVTLLGTQKDWERLLSKLDRLPAFGKQPSDFAKNLRPVISRFVRTFENPDDQSIRQFWNQIVTARMLGGVCGLPPYYVNGWINAFHHWNTNGNLVTNVGEGDSKATVMLDGIRYPWRDIRNIPVGYATAPLKVKGEGEDYNATCLAGMLGKRIRQGTPPGYAEAMKRVGFSLPSTVKDDHHYSLEPVPAWFVYRNAEKGGTATDGSPNSKAAERNPGLLWNEGSCPSTTSPNQF